MKQKIIIHASEPLNIAEERKAGYKAGYAECWHQFLDMNPYQLGIENERMRVVEILMNLPHKIGIPGMELISRDEALLAINVQDNGKRS